MKSTRNLLARSIAALTLACSATTAFALNDTSFLNDPEHTFFFDLNDVPTIKLTFSEDQWALLLTSTQTEREEVSGDFYFYKNNEEFHLPSIGIKVGGNTSFVLPENPSDPYVQANFTLDFDEFVDDQEISGFTKLKLKRFKDDATFAHEPLSNQIMHNFDVYTAHSSTFARLEIKVGDRDLAYYGLYRMNESVNRKEYLDKRFGEDNDGGGLWQGNNKDFGKAHFSRITDSWEGVGDFDGASFEYKGKGSKEEENTAKLVAFAQSVTNLEGDDFVAYVDEFVNVPLLLKGLASEAVLGHWDGFWGNGNNYYFYLDESDVMHFIPYDTDNTLGTSAIVGDVGTRDPINFSDEANAPLFVKKIMAVEKYREEYKTYIKALVTEDDLMVEDFSTAWLAKAHDMIRGFLSNWTGDNEHIVDVPASWSNQTDYRLWDFNSGRNWYETRKAAVMDAVKDPNQVFSSVYYRGVTNSWGTSLMTETSTNIWAITVDNNADTNSSGEPRFKFDINGDWSHNYGDDNADGIAEQTGEDIFFTEGFGKYDITFNAVDKSYTVEKHSGNEPVSTFNQLFFRGTPNGWGTSEMTLVSDHTWQIDVEFSDAENERFKFDVNADWSYNIGDTDSDGNAKRDEGDIAITEGAGTYRITINDSDESNFPYTVEKLSGVNQVPIADAGEDITIVIGETVTFDASASTDTDGTIESFAWSNGETTASFTETFNEAGTFTYTVTVTDNEGATATDSVVVTVKPEAPETVDVTFTCENGHTTNGTSVYIVGNIEALGNWSIQSASQQLNPTDYPTWTGTITLPANTDFEFKCVKADEDSFGISQWEGGSNNTANSDAATGNGQF